MNFTLLWRSAVCAVFGSTFFFAVKKAGQAVTELVESEALYPVSVLIEVDRHFNFNLDFLSFLLRRPQHLDVGGCESSRLTAAGYR